MGKAILLIIIIVLVLIIAYILKDSVEKNYNTRIKEKLDIETMISELKLQILKAESDALRGKDQAEQDLEFYKEQLKAAEELLTKIK